MADLGEIGYLRYSRAFSLPFPAYGFGTVQNARRRDGLIGGTVLEEGSPLPLCEVFVLWRPNMMPIARTFTDAAGNWEIDGFDSSIVDNYVVVIKDKAGGVVYNDAIYALVAPVA